MEIQKTFNTTKKEIESKKYNIFIGISIGNRWFTKENLRGYLKLALNYTKDKVLVLIADKIHFINYSVRNKSNTKKANLRRVLRKGDKFEKLLKELISELPIEKQSKIRILHWRDYEKDDEFYKKYSSIIYKEFNSKNDFKEDMLQIVKKSTKDRDFLEEEYLILSKYMLEEFVVLYSGVKIKNEYYSLYFYPQNTLLSGFIRKIQKRKVFSKLRKKLPKEKVSLAIVN